jgi:LysM repeat protein
MRRFLFYAFSAILFLTLLAQSQSAQSQSSSALDLIAEVNAFRASHDLAPYVIDPGLMTFAQAHSEYQASIGKFTHARADGSQPADYGVFENIGGGLNASASHMVNRQWADYWHTHTMIGFTESYVGAGAAWDGSVVFYTLVVRRTGGFTHIQPTAAPPGSTPGAGQSTSVVEIPITTSTPNPDGSMQHRVAPGQTLWSIAELYGVNVADLIALNGLNANNPVIYAGRDLIIRAAHTPTPTPTLTETPTPSPTATATRHPTRTPRLTVTPVPERVVQQAVETTLNNRYLAIGVTLTIGIALFLLVTFGIKDKK